MLISASQRRACADAAGRPPFQPYDRRLTKSYTPLNFAEVGCKGIADWIS